MTDERSSYLVGEDYTTDAAFYGVTDQRVDPGSVTLRVTPEGQATQTYTYPAAIVRDGPGRYHKDLTFTSVGVWKFEWDTGTPGGVRVRHVQVAAP